MPNTNPSDLDREALLPCPFCGGEPYMLAHTDTKDGFVHCYSIRCDVCGIEIGDEYESETLTSWNKRALPRASGVPEAEAVAYIAYNEADGERFLVYSADIGWFKERGYTATPLYASPPPVAAPSGEANYLNSIARKLRTYISIYTGDKEARKMADWCEHMASSPIASEPKDAGSVTDAAYRERNQVVAALAKCFPSGVKKTAIEGWAAAWHNCVYIDLPTGQASWHYHDDDTALFEGLPPYQGEWDGHSTPEKYERLSRLKDAGSRKAEKLGRFGHHPDPAIDFEIEVQALGDEISNRQHGFTNGTPSWDELENRVARALTFRVGGDKGAIEAKHALRTLASVFHRTAPSGAKP